MPLRTPAHGGEDAAGGGHAVDGAYDDPREVHTAQGLMMLKHALAAQKAEGEAALKLLAATPRPAAPPGTGTLVDVQA